MSFHHRDAGCAPNRADTLVLAFWRRWTADFAPGGQDDEIAAPTAFDELLHQSARPLFAAFYRLACALGNCASAPLGETRACGLGPCRDECLLLKLIERQQRGEPREALSAARALVDSDELGDILAAAQSLAKAMAARGLWLTEAAREHDSGERRASADGSFRA